MAPHPVVVDFAVALLVTSLACDLLAAAVDERELAIVAWWTLLFGTIAAAFAVLSGFAAAREVPPGVEVESIIWWHRAVALATLTAFTICVGWRAVVGGARPTRHGGVYWILVGCATAALVVTAYFGGTLVFGHGVGVEPR